MSRIVDSVRMRIGVYVGCKFEFCSSKIWMYVRVVEMEGNDVRKEMLTYDFVVVIVSGKKEIVICGGMNFIQVSR